LNRWFIVHDLLAYNQHPNMIGNIVKKTGIPEPRFSAFGDIKKGDLVIYYATKDYVVVGIFEVVSDIIHLTDDEYWKEDMIYKIKPHEMPPVGNYLDFKKLIRDPSASFDLFPNKKKWGQALQGKTCRLLTERDFLTIREALSKTNYLKSIDETKATVTKWHKKYGKKTIGIAGIEAGRHQRAIDKWRLEEEGKFGLFKPNIKTNTVDINEILPKGIWLKENTKYVDGLAKLEIGGQPIYQSILEVQHKGSREDLCVRVSIVLPFVTRVDIVSDEDDLGKISELLERIADPNIVKSRVRFYTYKEFLG